MAWQLYYLDDFLFAGPPQSNACAEALRLALKTFQKLGVPVASHKTEGPTTRLTFLGIQLDIVEMSLSLASDKLTRLRALILSWRNRRAATKRELQSLVGHLSHAAFVVIPGCTFLRRMINLMSTAKLPHHHLRLNSEFRSDLLWWASFLPLWNGRSIVPPEEPAHTLTSDASGSWGCGAVTEASEFFQVKWPDSWAQVNIAVKEMVPVVIAVATWGCRWGPCTLLVRSDNMAVVCALSAGSARDPALMHQLRCLHFFTAQYQIPIKSRHLAGSCNLAADALSRNKQYKLIPCLHPTGSQGTDPNRSTVVGPAGAPTPRLDLGRLEDNVSYYPLAPSTLRSYSSDQRRYSQFCTHAAVPPWPLSERVLCLFAARLGTEGLTHQTIKCYLSAVRFLSDPFLPGKMPVLQYVLRGLKRSPRPPPFRTRLPVTPSILRALKSQWVAHAQEVDYIMLWAAVCVGFSSLSTPRFHGSSPQAPRATVCV